MKNIILKFLVILLRILYLPMKLFKVKNKITYITRESNEETLDFKNIRQELEKEYPEYKNVVLAKKIEEKNGILKQLLPSLGNIFKQMYNLATSKVIILDTYCITACVLSHKKETKVVQIWHALGAIKKFGYQTIGTKSGANASTAKIMCMHKNYDYVLAPSKVTGDLYKEAFNVDEEKVKYIGMPRIDYILSENEDIKNRIYQEYPILRKKENILYVPTYRKGQKIKLDELIEKIDTSKYNLIIKLHPLDLKEYKYIKKDGVIYDNKFKTYDLIKIADRIITDYSSLSIEVSLRNLPVYFYTYDLQQYIQDTGLNFDFENEPIGRYKTEKVDELINLLEQDYDYNVLNEFKNKYISVNTENCTKQIVDFINKLSNNDDVNNSYNYEIKEKVK